MLAPTFASCVLTFAPYILTFKPCACGVSLISTDANIPLAVVVVTSCNLQRSGCIDAKVRTQGAKVGASISASRYGMQQQHATTTTTTTNRADMINTARCSNHCNLREGTAVP